MLPSKRPSEASKAEFLQNTKEERDRRSAEKLANIAATRIQNFMRNAYGKKIITRQLRSEVDLSLRSAEQSPVQAIELFWTGQKLLFLMRMCPEDERLTSYCKILLASMESSEMKDWYVSLSFNKQFAVKWIEQVKQFLLVVSQRLTVLKPGLPKDDKDVNLFLNVIVLFTDYTLWKLTAKCGDIMKPSLHKLCSTFIYHLASNGYFFVLQEVLLSGLCKPTPGFSRHSLPAAMGIRLLALCHFSPKLLILFIRHVLTVPASFLHLQQLSPESFHKLETVKFVAHLVRVLDSKEATQSVYSQLKQNSALYLLANLIYLGSFFKEVIIEEKVLEMFVNTVMVLVPLCGSSKASGHSAASNWHPLLGWIVDNIDKRSVDSLSHVRRQLEYLWHSTLIHQFFLPILTLTPALAPQPRSKGKSMKAFLPKQSGVSQPIDDISLFEACRICNMYNALLQFLPQMATDILVGLGCHPSLVTKFWYFVKAALGLDPERVLHMKSSGKGYDLHSLLTLFCQITQFLIAILDDEELFVQDLHFTVADLIEMSSFLNRLVFKIIWELQSSPGTHDLLVPCHALLTLLYSRDSRRQFCDGDHWLLRDLKASAFMSALKANKPQATELLNKLPHVIPHRKRVEIFYQHVETDRQRLGLSRSRSQPQPATYITCHRGRILEDGYTQLSFLSADALKRAVKVKFVNEQGLEEAGIDEMGVFKEFLEETVKLAFDPTLNLFKTNTAGHLYPSPTSHIQENHLSFFEFVGKMLGKAVYEGIVVDVPLAPFFLSQMLEHHNSALYSSLDELPSLDPELYRSLTFVKHQDGDVADLCLFFSVDEDFMGKVISHELMPGGCGIPVTNENRISYVHKMAHFHMRTQLKTQSSAFVRGFHSMIPKLWISCFSSKELQRLISGDNVEVNVDDLRRHTQYFGGYHDNHKVITWLWDIVKNFTREEKASFLKFVTSCSKPPLLGFAHLEPPFSIRFVDVADEEDRGDSVGSVLRGFFSVRHSGSAAQRLPTASTCFNLLKLPNYSRKAILREKLKYSISANAGFELS